MNHPQDHFSAIATVYKDGRITYPSALYEYLSSLCKERELAWDCATGSGQAAKDLSNYFDRVIATDISDSLLSHTESLKNVEFRQAPAEVSGIDANSLDLVAVAQAIHWFEFDAFWKETARVLKPNGILAFWGYVWPSVNHRIDELLEEFKTLISGFWPEKSRYLHGLYADVEAPLKRVDCPSFWIEENWTASQYLTHLDSWSGTRYCREAFDANPLSKIRNDLLPVLGSAPRIVKWPLILKAYRNAEQGSRGNG